MQTTLMSVIRTRNNRAFNLADDARARLKSLARNSITPPAPDAPPQAVNAYWQTVANACARQFARDVVSPHNAQRYGECLARYLRTGEKDAEQAVVLNAASVAADPSGGYFILPDQTGRIVAKVQEISPMRQVATVEETSVDAKQGLVDDQEFGGGWIGDEETRTDTATPQIGEWRVPIFEQYAQPVATQRLIDDARDGFESWLEGRLALKFARIESPAFITGDGAKKPRGITTYPTSTTGDGSTLQYVPTGAASTFITPTSTATPADCLVDTQAALKDGYRANAVWMMNRATSGAVKKFKDANGRPIWTDPTTPGNPPLLLGDPVLFATDMPNVGANAYPIAYGDFGAGYEIVDHRSGIVILRDPFTQKGKVVFYARRRVGGGIVDFDAVKLVKVAVS